MITNPQVSQYQPTKLIVGISSWYTRGHICSKSSVAGFSKLVSVNFQFVPVNWTELLHLVK